MKITMLAPRRSVRHGISLLGVVVFAWGWLAADALTIFIHLPSLLLTVGGTVAVTLLSFSADRLRGLVSAVREALADNSVSAEIAQVKLLARHYRRRGITGLDEVASDVANPFLRRGVELIAEWRQPAEIQAMLEAEHLRMTTYYEDCRRILLTIGKLLPAFGLIGTLVSLVLIIRQANALSAETVGPALSLAILTTLYGAILANAVVLPFEAKLQTHIDHLTLRFQIGLAATQLIGDQAYPSTIESRLGCFVTAGAAFGSGANLSNHFTTPLSPAPADPLASAYQASPITARTAMQPEAG